MRHCLLYNREFGVHVGERAATSRHQMYLAKLAVPLEGALSYSATSGVEPTAVSAPLIVAPGHDHLLGATGEFVTFFAQPQSQLGAAIAAQTSRAQPLSGLLGTRLEGFARSVSHHTTDDALDAVAVELAALLETSSSACVDSRVEQVQEIVTQADPLPSLDALADAVGLSRFRLSHLFREQTGTTLRRFLLWEKLIRALDHLPNTSSITAAAHAASFSDHAHLTRTMRALVGQPPSFVRDALCPSTW